MVVRGGGPMMVTVHVIRTMTTAVAFVLKLVGFQNVEQILKCFRFEEHKIK